ncbi:general transcriptional corepressor ssn6 [Fusarium subglutinans]|uniref:General transcriptional corepressor ssn6 n=1 Tax=Gibberella subglutinans TaxID=42677 RepID=A0A8H5L8J0_GIBSU|nr:general transcriptional corepressor ssn6 [Fusarium subglutinans]KAF5588330.1 general transcriptional corepressor ssn6 [Fusarium subglutinans]
MHDWHNGVRTNSFKNEAELMKQNTQHLKANRPSPYYVKMSFGYAVGDVIAILGLFERIAIELRNYKGAPMHFQRLYVELDLMHSTLKHVMMLEPESPTEHQTMEKVRAIIMHCKQPLQSMAEKMRAKESSLGHFKTTRSLSSIGTRLHWSMIAQGDVEDLRKTILSQMAAINILLSVQQMNRIEHIALQSRNIGTSQFLILEKHANTIAGHASNILTITSRTQSAIDTLAVDANTNAEAQSKQANMINKNLNAIEKTMLGLAQKSENTTGMVRRQTAFLGRHVKILFRVMQNLKDLFKLHMLLDITAQLKHIIRAIEAIPLHLTLDIVRLDDAHGESWALPLQACTTWRSFNDMLRFVVYANNRPGADYITQNLFNVLNAKTGKHVDHETWAMSVKPGFHVEQAMVVRRDHSLESCMDLDCPGTLAEQVLQHVNRKVWVRYLQSMEPIQNMDDAQRVLSETPTHPMANAFIGLELLRTAEGRFAYNSVQVAREHLEIAVKSDQSRDSLDGLSRAIRLNAYLFEPWYNLGVLYDFYNQPMDAQDAFIKCLELAPGLLNVQTRVDAQKAYIESDDIKLLEDSLIRDMIEAPLSDQYSKVYPVPASTDHITLDPLRQDSWEDNNADEESLSDDDYTDWEELSEDNMIAVDSSQRMA